MNEKKSTSVSIIIPVYNESENIEYAVTQTSTYLKNNFKDFEIVIVESGSSDNSSTICDQLKEKFSLKNIIIKVHHEGAKKGYGSAIKCGFQIASKDMALIMAPDMPFPIEKLRPAVEAYENRSDKKVPLAILSYRNIDDRSRRRKIQSFVFNLLTKLILGLKVKVVNSAFKLLPKEVYKNINITACGWLVDANIVYHLQQLKIKFIELPVPLIERARGKSSITFLSIFSMLLELINFRLKTKK
ncbi:MAG: glycosyltransferase family 2 protein [Oligoflexia bacterium]|nr:glycosyltransferase family 2 protein [Oligoflexia bacterium]